MLVFDYSMIVATRPEPTVLPPSRALGNEIWMFFLVFATYYSSYYLIWHYIFTVLKNFRAKIEPAAKYRFSPYPSLLHGASTMFDISLRKYSFNVSKNNKLNIFQFMYILLSMYIWFRNFIIIPNSNTFVNINNIHYFLANFIYFLIWFIRTFYVKFV